MPGLSDLLGVSDYGGRTYLPNSPAPAPQSRKRRKRPVYRARDLNDQQTERRVRMIRKAFPALKDQPDVILQAAQLDADDDDLVRKFSKLEIWDSARKRIRSMRDMDDDTQRQLWDISARATKRTFESLGYTPPSDDFSWGDLGGALVNATPLGGAKKLVQGDIVGGALGMLPGGGPSGTIGLIDQAGEGFEQIGNLADSLPLNAGTIVPKAALEVANVPNWMSDQFMRFAGRPALHALDVASDLPLHAYRTAALVNSEAHGGQSPEWGQLQTYSLNPGDWIDAWEETSNPRSSFYPDTRGRAREVLEDDAYLLNLSQALATGTTLEDFVGRRADQGTPEFERKYLRAMQAANRKDVKEAIKVFNNGRIGPGADLATSVGLDLNTPAGQIVSTGFDFTVQWIFDPFMVAGKVMKDQRILRSLDGKDFREAIPNIMSDEHARISAVHGEDWMDQVARGDLTSAQLTRIRGAGHQAMNARIVEAFRDPDAGLAILGRQYPYMKRFIYDLQVANDAAVVEKLRIRGLADTPANRAAVVGFESPADVVQAYSNDVVLTGLASGHTARATSPAVVELPKMTRTGTFMRDKRMNLANRISDWADPFGQNEIYLVPETEIDGTVQAARAIGANIPEPEQGVTRLYRVVSGTGRTNIRAAPSYITDAKATLADANAEGHWWTDELNRAVVEASHQIGPGARLHYVDVPTEQARTFLLSERADPLARKALRPDHEYLITGDDIVKGANDVGSAREYIEHNGKVVPKVAKPLTAMARYFEMATSLLPTQNVLAMHGSEFYNSVSPYLDLWFKGPRKDRIMNEMLTNPSPALRRQIIRGVTEDIFYASGWMSDPQLAQVAEGYLSGIGRARYGHGGADELIVGSNPVVAPLNPVADAAEGIMVPSFRDLRKAADRSRTLSVMKLVNSDAVDAFMGQYWKPAMLLRLAFIPRAAGEEMLATLMRYPDLLKSRAALKLDDVLKGQHPDEPIWMVKPLLGMVEQMQSRIPKHALEDSKHWTNRFAYFLESTANGWIRGLPERFVNPDELRFYRALADHPSLQRVFVQEYYGVGKRPGVSGSVLTERKIQSLPADVAEGLHPGGARAWIDADELNAQDEFYTIPMMKASGDEAQATMRVDISQFDFSDATQMEFGGKLTWVVNHNASDPVRQVSMVAQGAHVHSDQMAALDGVLNQTRRNLQNNNRGTAAEQFFDEIEDSPVRAVTMIREAVDERSDIYDDLYAWMRMSRSAEPQLQRQAASALRHAKMNAQRSGNPALIMLAESFEAMPQDLRLALGVTRGSILRELGIVEDSMSPRMQQWDELFRMASMGDQTAADELAIQMFQRRLSNPEFAKQVNDQFRSMMASRGRRVVQPTNDRMMPVYYPVVDGQHVGTATAAMAERNPRFVELALDPAEQQATADALANSGNANQVITSGLGTTDYDEALEWQRIINDALPDAQVGLHYVEVPTVDVRRTQGQASAAGLPLGEYEHVLPEVDRYRGLPIDPDGDIVRVGTAGVPGITREQAFRDWAEKAIEDNNNLLRSPTNGRYLHEIGTRAAKEGRYRIEWLATQGPASEHLPTQVLGPKRLLPSEQNIVNRIATVGFDKVISPAIAALARQPLFFRNAGRRWTIAEREVLPMYLDEDLALTMEGIAAARGITNLDEVRDVWRGLPDRVKRMDPGDPAFLENLPEAYQDFSIDELSTMRRYIENQERAYTQAAEVAMHGAFIDTFPFIDDHRIRSQMADVMHNLVPFWFAEEQFLKRWARTMVHSPEALARAQLIYQGMQHVGLITENEFGEDVFVYPGSTQLQNLLAVASDKLGFPATLPIGSAFTGQVSFALPGVSGENLGVPGFSPLVGIPLTAMSRAFPELDEDIGEILGPMGTDRSLVEQLVPVSVQRLYKAITASPDSDAQMASAMIQAMQFMEYNGLSPDEDAQPDVWETYIDRVKNWSRTILIERAILGFVGPTTAIEKIEGSELQREFAGLLKLLPIEEATAAFIKKYPDATPYTVFDTENIAGAPMPVGSEVQQYIDGNGKFIDRYPIASAWFLPQGDQESPTSRGAFDAQVQAGFRERRTPREWQEAYWYRRASSLYFDSRDDYEQALANARTTEQRRQIEDIWTDWKDKYLTEHPSFAHQLQSKDSQLQRKEVIDQLTLALNDPDRPTVKHEGELRTMIQAWHDYDRHVRTAKGQTSERATKYRKNLRATYMNWAEGYLSSRPQMRALWERVFLPELGLTASEEANYEMAS